MRTVATLSAGLRENSRIMMKLRGHKASYNTILLAEIADRLAVLIGGKEPPQRLVEQFLFKKEKSSDVMKFASVEDFNKARNRILRGK